MSHTCGWDKQYALNVGWLLLSLLLPFRHIFSVRFMTTLANYISLPFKAYRQTLGKHEFNKALPKLLVGVGQHAPLLVIPCFLFSGDAPLQTTDFCQWTVLGTLLLCQLGVMLVTYLQNSWFLTKSINQSRALQLLWSQSNACAIQVSWKV